MVKNYISVKMVKAEPCKAWKDFKGHITGDEGYKIYYPDGYVSWCPKDIFESQYLELEKENTISQCDVDNFISKVEAIKMGDKTTVVQATCKNGFTIIDGSACVDPNNFNMEIGKECCMEHIKDKVWKLLGFLLQSAKNGFKGDK
ncbi:Gp49 family protein [Megamonas funiformis]|uniref:Gp49 family protein n=1 Tax=Megamonas funiformis TaxID=437897 RepID=UPI003FED60D9